MQMPTVRIRVDFGPDISVGPGKIALLEHIEDCGSLSQAARDMKISYRRAWELLESLNNSFRGPVAICNRGGRGGGGATLTELGRELITAYRSFDSELQSRAKSHFGRLARRRRASLS
jgi:molybdate transport system regulatory protein